MEIPKYSKYTYSCVELQKTGKSRGVPLYLCWWGMSRWWSAAGTRCLVSVVGSPQNFQIWCLQPCLQRGQICVGPRGFRVWHAQCEIQAHACYSGARIYRFVTTSFLSELKATEQQRYQRIIIILLRRRCDSLLHDSKL